MIKRIFLFLVSSLAVCQVWGQISGVVLDENNTPLPSAYILLLPDSLLSVTNIDGYFTYTNLPDGAYELQASYLSFATDTLLVKVKNGESNSLRIRLQPSATVLQAVEVTDEHAKQEETLHTEHIHEDFFQKKSGRHFCQFH